MKKNKLNINHQDIEIKIKFNPDEISLDDLLELSKNFILKIKEKIGINQYSEDPKTNIVSIPLNKKEIDIIERPSIRQRIPNEVDLKKIKLKKAKLEETQIRCPSCGQSHVVIIEIDNNIYLLQKRDKEFKIIHKPFNIQEYIDNKYDIFMKKIDTPLHYNQELKKYKVYDKNTNLLVDNNTKTACPICWDELSNIKTWKDAYKKPEKYFDYDQPCEICGGETTSVIKDKEVEGSMGTIFGKEFIYTCEECGYEFRK